jgi:hypothetical protein
MGRKCPKTTENLRTRKKSTEGVGEAIKPVKVQPPLHPCPCQNTLTTCRDDRSIL